MTNVYQGEGSLQKIEKIVKSHDPRSVLLLTGDHSYERSGIEKYLAPCLFDRHVIRSKVHHKFATIEDIENVIAIIKNEQTDLVIAVGGGRVLDVAKAASLLHQENEPLDAYVKGLKTARGKNIFRILIPTTAGSGAEITPFSVIYIDKIKYSLAHPSMLPEHIILAPELTESLGPKTTAETGCDALAQAIEGFWSVRATPESMNYSREAIPLILNSLLKAVHSPTPVARERMLLGAHLAGRSIALAKTTAAHALSYPLTAHYGIPHGHAVILSLPYFFPVNEEVNDDNAQEGAETNSILSRMEQVFEMLGVQSGIEAQNKLINMVNELGLENQVRQFGIKESDLTILLVKECNQARLANNPVRISETLLREIIHSIY